MYFSCHMNRVIAGTQIRYFADTNFMVCEQSPHKQNP
jgi:hypothetical protein